MWTTSGASSCARFRSARVWSCRICSCTPNCTQMFFSACSNCVFLLVTFTIVFTLSFCGLHSYRPDSAVPHRSVPDALVRLLSTTPTTSVVVEAVAREVFFLFACVEEIALRCCCVRSFFSFAFLHDSIRRRWTRGQAMRMTTTKMTITTAWTKRWIRAATYVRRLPCRC